MIFEKTNVVGQYSQITFNTLEAPGHRAVQNTLFAYTDYQAFFPDLVRNPTLPAEKGWSSLRHLFVALSFDDVVWPPALHYTLGNQTLIVFYWI